MLGSYVCRQCKARLLTRITPVITPQRQPRATFLSLRRDKTQDDTKPSYPEARPQSQPDVAQHENLGGPGLSIRNVGEQLQTRCSVGRYSSYVEEDADGKMQTSPRTPSDAKRADSEDSTQNPLETSHGPAYNIQQALKRGIVTRRGDVDQAWELFEKNYTSRDCKAFKEPSFGDAALLNSGKIFADLLKGVNGAFCNSRVKSTVTPTVVLLKYEQLGIAQPEYWVRQTLSYLTNQAILAVNASPEEITRDLPSILFELVSVWRLFFQCKGLNKVPLDSVSTEWNLPAIEALPRTYNSKDFNMRLQEFHPGFVGSPILGFCAVYFYTLSDAMNAIEPLHKQAEPFLQFLGRLLAGSFIDPVFKHTQYSSQFQALAKEIQQEIIQEIDNAPRRALIALGATGETLTESEMGDPAANVEAFHLKRIARAVESKASVRTLNTLWEEAILAYTADNKPAIPPRIYNAFLSGYMVLFQAKRSVDVWNHMIAHGVMPDIQSWVALLEGCEKAKDLNGFNAMWTRMLNTGVEPDNYAWTTRVHGLFSLRQVNLGLAALDDMGKRWIAAETAITNPQAPSRLRKGAKTPPPSTKAVNNRAKPSVEVINGAVTALVQIPAPAMRHGKRVELVQKILAWAGNFQIKPDAITYNSLIQLYLRAGDYSIAFKVLQQMEKDGFPGDVATHTMLITFSFDNNSFANLNETQQTEKIIALFGDIEASGLKLNAHIYGTAIDRLLKQYSNHKAVRTIIQHMHDRNMVPSAHVYTSLVTYYFQQEPPAIPAVDSLVDRFFTSHRVVTDRILFDRTIEGYAAHGEVGKMMSVLTKMSKQGGLPGWSALTAIVEALARNGDFERARAVVRDVERGQGVAKGGVMPNAQGEARFFAVVRGYGVGLEDGMTIAVRGEDRTGSSEDQADTGAQPKRGVQQVVQQEEDSGILRERPPPPNPPFQQDCTGAGYEQLPEIPRQERPQPASRWYQQATTGAEYERKPVKAPFKEEEDVHGFLTDEHKDIPSRVHKP